MLRAPQVEDPNSGLPELSFQGWILQEGNVGIVSPPLESRHQRSRCRWAPPTSSEVMR